MLSSPQSLYKVKKACKNEPCRLASFCTFFNSSATSRHARSDHGGHAYSTPALTGEKYLAQRGWHTNASDSDRSPASRK